MPCDCKCYMAFPHSAVGWSAVCDRVLPDRTHLLLYIKANSKTINIKKDIVRTTQAKSTFFQRHELGNLNLI